MYGLCGLYIAEIDFTGPVLYSGKSHLLLVQSAVYLDNFNLRSPIDWSVQSGE